MSLRPRPMFIMIPKRVLRVLILGFALVILYLTLLQMLPAGQGFTDFAKTALQNYYRPTNSAGSTASNTAAAALDAPTLSSATTAIPTAIAATTSLPIDAVSYESPVDEYLMVENTYEDPQHGTVDYGSNGLQPGLGDLESLGQPFTEITQPVSGIATTTTTNILRQPDTVSDTFSNPLANAALANVDGIDSMDGTLAALDSFMSDIARDRTTIEHELSMIDAKLNPETAQITASEVRPLFQQLAHLSGNAVDAAADLKAFMNKLKLQAERKTMQQLAQAQSIADSVEDLTTTQAQTTRPTLAKREEDSREEEYEPPEDRFPWMKDASFFGMHLYRRGEWA